MIFPWLWRILPGGAILKTFALLSLLAVLTAILFAFVFPSIEDFFVPPPVVESLGISNFEPKSQLPFTPETA